MHGKAFSFCTQQECRINPDYCVFCVQVHPVLMDIFLLSGYDIKDVCEFDCCEPLL